MRVLVTQGRWGRPISSNVRHFRGSTGLAVSITVKDGCDITCIRCNACAIAIWRHSCSRCATRDSTSMISKPTAFCYRRYRAKAFRAACHCISAAMRFITAKSSGSFTRFAHFPNRFGRMPADEKLLCAAYGGRKAERVLPFYISAQST